VQPVHHNVVILGGGPAGLAAALAAVEHGAGSVCLVERRRQWGVPVQCGEFVPKLLTQLVPIPSECVAQRVEHIRLFHNGEHVRTVRAPGFVLHRHRWEGFLAERARRKGVVLLQAAAVRRIDGCQVRFVQGADPRELAAEVVIGADGPRSLVREAIGEARPPLAHGLQQVHVLARPLVTADLFFEPRFGAGYAWCFPKGRVANVGLAVDAEARPLLGQWLEGFVCGLVAQGVLQTGAPLERTGGSLPVGPPAECTVRGPTLLAGDAAGQMNSLTGAGIYPAVACGQMAGQAAARAILRGDAEPLRRYETRWRALLGDHLAQAWRSRQAISEAPPGRHRERVLSGWRL
jgi:geranylgeranyl reductase family protein